MKYEDKETWKKRVLFVKTHTIILHLLLLY
uniref:Uncharacterized protein n=1 Tax=Rhizophora mucronata TaxID=61149 RepID=A0A2P2QVL9_RHIMU